MGITLFYYFSANNAMISFLYGIALLVENDNIVLPPFHAIFSPIIGAFAYSFVFCYFPSTRKGKRHGVHHLTLMLKCVLEFESKCNGFCPTSTNPIFFIGFITKAPLPLCKHALDNSGGLVAVFEQQQNSNLKYQN